jgi:thymidylate synthase (FAD)
MHSAPLNQKEVATLADSITQESVADAVADVTFRSDMTVELVRSSAHDDDVLFSARVSTLGDKTLADAEADPDLKEKAEKSEADVKRDRGLINYLMRDRHGSPFEHNSMTFYVQAPIFVFREFMRHRMASYNEESGRYKELDPVFYVPGPERNLVQVGKPGAYEFHPGSPEQLKLVQAEAQRTSTEAYGSYQRMLKEGVAREVARIVLPLNIYSSMYVTMNARALMNFLSLRTKGYEGVETTFPSFPQREIEMCAEKMEAEWAKLMPMTQWAFNQHHRVAP